METAAVLVRSNEQRLVSRTGNKLLTRLTDMAVLFVFPLVLITLLVGTAAGDALRGDRVLAIGG